MAGFVSSKPGDAAQPDPANPVRVKPKAKGVINPIVTAFLSALTN
jgi:hypothetical protein